MAIIVRTKTNINNLEVVDTVTILPKDRCPKTDPTNHIFIFNQQDLPTDFYKEYNKYYVKDNILYYNPKL